MLSLSVCLSSPDAYPFRSQKLIGFSTLQKMTKISMKINLIRNKREGKAVHGTITLQMGRDAILCSTLENADFIIPEGTYELVLTMSPKFGVVLPLLENVPGRSGIRIHTGTKPEHSKGCILVTPFGKKQITDFIHQNYMSNEKTLIRISREL